MWKPGSDKPVKAAVSKAAPAAASASTAGNEARPTSKSALSQKTLAMKFMQRKKQAEVRKQTAAQERKKQDAWIVDESPEDDRDGSNSGAIVCVQDVPDPSLPLIFGRRSFGGFNKGVEDEYREVSRQQRFAASEEKELRDEVSAEEMTDRMIKYTGLMRGGGGNKQGGNKQGGNKQGGNRAPKRQRK